MSYPDPAVTAFLQAHFVALRLYLDDREMHRHFRDYQVVWTPTLAFLDRRQVCHYQAVGYLPPADLLAQIRIGLARVMLARGRYTEAATHLEQATVNSHPDLAAEALYWQGMAGYLRTNQRNAMMYSWLRLQQEHPDSIWARRLPPEDATAEVATEGGSEIR